MSQKGKTYKVGVFGHYGNNNLGDEAIIQSTIQNLRERFQHIEFIGLSLKPNNTNFRHGIESFPIRFDSSKYFKSNFTDGNNSGKEKVNNKTASIRDKIRNLLPKKIKNSPVIFGFLYFLGNLGSEIIFLRKAREKLKKLDGVIICGSNQFVDERGGPWGHPFTLMRWVLLAKSTNTKIFFASVGAGPINHRLSYWMLNIALSNADYVSFRDKGSKELIEKHISGLEGFVFPDLAHSLKTKSEKISHSDGIITVGINPMPVFASHYWPENIPEKYNNYINELAHLVKHVLERGFLTNIYNNHTSDIPVIEDLLKKIQNMTGVNLENVKITKNDTVQDLVDTILGTDLVVATRFHSIVLPAHFLKPVLGICYHRKSVELMKNMGLGKFFVEVNDINRYDLCEKFDTLFENKDDLRENLRTNAIGIDNLMDEQWNRICRMIKA